MLSIDILSFAAKQIKNTLEHTGNSEFQGFLFLRILVVQQLYFLVSEIFFLICCKVLIFVEKSTFTAVSISCKISS